MIGFILIDAIDAGSIDAGSIDAGSAPKIYSFL
jgi:hypothetical protein